MGREPWCLVAHRATILQESSRALWVSNQEVEGPLLDDGGRGNALRDSSENPSGEQVKEHSARASANGRSAGGAACAWAPGLGQQCALVHVCVLCVPLCTNGREGFSVFPAPLGLQPCAARQG